MTQPLKEIDQIIIVLEETGNKANLEEETTIIIGKGQQYSLVRMIKTLKRDQSQIMQVRRFYYDCL